MERLRRYSWPGNIRELENLTRRIAALYPQEVITEALIEAELGASAPLLGLSGGRAAWPTTRRPARRRRRTSSSSPASSATSPICSARSAIRRRRSASIIACCAISRRR